jgi:hypothetical protein
MIRGRRTRTWLGGGVAVTLLLAMQVGVGTTSADAATTFSVTTTADIAANAGACGDTSIKTPPNPSSLSLREATCLANNNGGTSTINIPAGTYTLSHGELEVGTHSGQSVSLSGEGAATTTINAGNSSRVLDFDENIVGGVVGSVSGLTITGGADSTFGGAGIIGGSSNVTSSADSLTVTNSVVTGNHANGLTPDVTNSPGGGIQFIGGSLSISNSTISNNSSASSPGSGVAYAATGATGGEGLTISNTTFSGNSATNTNAASLPNGGALDLRGPASTTMQVTDSRFVKNTVVATAGIAVGAGIREEGGALTVLRSTFTGNSVTNLTNGPAAWGGAIEVTTGTATLNYNRFTGNVASAGSALFLDTGAGAVDARENWFGCNGAPGTTGCDTVVSGAVSPPTLSPRLVLTGSASPNPVDGPNATSTVTASLTTDTSGGAVAAANLTAFDGLPVSWSDPQPVGATVSSATTNLSSGTATVTYNSHSTSGAGHVVATLDNGTSTVPVTVDRAPTIGTDPNDQTVNAGDTATFTAAATGFPAPTVQWQRSTNGGASFSDIAGATSTTYSFTAAVGDDGNEYRAVFTNTVSTVTTTAATLAVNQPPAFTSGATAIFVTGTAGSFAISTSGKPAVSTIDESGTLPSGLTFTDNGDGTAKIAGRPDAGSGGTYPVTLTAHNGISPDATQALTIQVNQAPVVTTDPDSETVQPNTSVTFTAAASGVPTPTVQWQRSTDGGTSFSDIPGATSTTYTFTAVAADDGNQYRAVFTNSVSSATTAAATLRVGTAPAFTSTDATTFKVGTAGNFTITVSGVPNAVISETGTLPAWLTLTDNGDNSATLSGTPPAGSGGLYSFTLQASNGFSPSASQAFTLTVDESPSITSADHTTFTVGTSGTFTVTTSAGNPTATTLSETGALPSGLSFVDNSNGTATLSGTPDAGTTGTYPITITAAATGGSTTPAQQGFTLTVHGPPAITSADHTTFTVGTSGTFTVTTSAGNPTATTLSKAGALPSGVTFVDNGDGTATLAGTPAANTGGSYPITITASNGIDPDDTQAFTLTVHQPPRISSADHATFTRSVAGAFTVTTTPGVPSATALSAPSADLPPGTTFVDNGDGTATFGGTPTVDGSYTFTITASNGVSPDATQTFTATVNGAPTITSADHTTFTVGQNGTFTVTTAAGTPSTTTLTETGALPSGVSFVDNGDGTATIAGTPDLGTGGAYPITITAANSALNSTQSFTLSVTESPQITSADHTTLTTGSSGTFTITTIAGNPTTTTLTETGALPSGVSFVDNGDGTATLSGTPAAGTGGSYPVTIRAANTVGHADQSFTLTVDEAPSITSADHTTFIVGSAGTFTVTTGVGFPAPPTLTETGALPSGVSFVDNGDGTATLSGTPAAGTGGSYPLTIKAGNGVNPDATQAFTLSVNEAPSITSADRTTFTIGASGTFTVVSTGVPHAAITETGALPSGVTFVDNGDGTGTLAGTPDPGTNATYPLTFRATNSTAHVDQAFTLTVVKVAQTITITSTPPAHPVVGGTYTITAVSDSTLPVSFSVDAATTGSACSLSGSTVSFDHSGTCVIDADQAGNGTYQAAPQVQQSLSVSTVATAVGVVSSTSPTVFGQGAHATATVTADSGTPAGTVQFAVDGTDLGAPVTVSGGTATSSDLTDSSGNPLAPGSHAVSAAFTPDDPTTYANASGSVTQVVDQAGTSLTLAVHKKTITAAVGVVRPGAGAPSGSVDFTVDGASIGSAPIVHGVATLHHRVKAGKTQHVAASYGGDADFTGSSASTARHDPSIVATVKSRHPKTHFGWYRSPVTIIFACTTHGAPLARHCPSTVHLTHNGAGQSVTRTIEATDGGTSTVVVRDIDIDQVAPSVRVAGVRNGKVYEGAAPALRCVANDRLSGVASCTITKHTTGDRTKYRATAVDRAGNKTSTSGSYRSRAISIQGAPFVRGAFNVKLGHTYTVVVHSTKRPTYYDAAPVPTKPFVRDQPFRRAGHHRWALGVTMTQSLSGYKYWNIGVKIGKVMHVIRIRVVG